MLKNIENKGFFVNTWVYFQENILHFDIHALTLQKIKRKLKIFFFLTKFFPLFGCYKRFSQLLAIALFGPSPCLSLTHVLIYQFELEKVLSIAVSLPLLQSWAGYLAYLSERF